MFLMDSFLIELHQLRLYNELHREQTNPPISE